MKVSEKRSWGVNSLINSILIESGLFAHLSRWLNKMQSVH